MVTKRDGGVMFNKSKVIEKYHSAVEKIAMADSQSGSQNLKLLPGASSMIGVDVKIDGKIVSEQNLVIEGAVKGSITAKKAEVLVGKTGSLTANISAKVVRIEGTVAGDICGSENVIIANTGNVLGNIDSPRVSLEDGAKFKGSITMDPDESTVTDLPLGSPAELKAHRAGNKAGAQIS